MSRRIGRRNDNVDMKMGRKQREAELVVVVLGKRGGDPRWKESGTYWIWGVELK